MIIKIIFEHIEEKKVPETIPNQTLKEISDHMPLMMKIKKK